MNNIIELNQIEISAVSGGDLGSMLGRVGTIAGTFIGCLMDVIFHEKILSLDSYVPKKYANYINITRALVMTGIIIACQWVTSFVFATVGNILSAVGNVMLGNIE